MYTQLPLPYLRYLEEKLKMLEKKQRELEHAHDQLEKKLSQLQPVHIDHIHYKIQELTVQELKGTLNIGMSALTDPEEIKKWLSKGTDEEEAPFKMENVAHGQPDADQEACGRETAIDDEAEF